jgi:hypothetical protein
MQQQISSWKMARTDRLAVCAKGCARVKHIGRVGLFALLLFSIKKEATALPVLKESICTIFPVERIVSEIDAGYGYEHDEKQVYETYDKIADRTIELYRAERARLKETNSTINDAYDVSESKTGKSSNYQCDYIFTVEYNSKRLGIITTDQWIRYLDYEVYTRNPRYVLGILAFSRYELHLEFSKIDGDLLRFYVRKYNINFNKFPFYLMKQRYEVSGREVGLSLKKEEFPDN